MWLFDPAVVGKQCYVQVKQTRESGYRKGDYEGRCGYVISVSDPRSALETSLEREANVQFDGDDKTEITAFPVRYLVPVPPSNLKDLVLALDGSKKGQMLVVEGISGAYCVVSSVPPGVMFEMSKDALVQIRRSEEV